MTDRAKGTCSCRDGQRMATVEEANKVINVLKAQYGLGDKYPGYNSELLSSS